MKNLVLVTCLLYFTVFSLAGGPKNNSIKESIKSELLRQNFVEKVGLSGDVLVQFRVDSTGKIVVEDSNAQCEELESKFIAFVQSIHINPSISGDQVYKMRFVFRQY